jgi:hypothetical protein
MKQTANPACQQAGVNRRPSSANRHPSTVIRHPSSFTNGKVVFKFCLKL